MDTKRSFSPADVVNFHIVKQPAGGKPTPQARTGADGKGRSVSIGAQSDAIVSKSAVPPQAVAGGIVNVRSKGRSDPAEQRFNQQLGALIAAQQAKPVLPVAVKQFTAMASEHFAHAIQDHREGGGVHGAINFLFSRLAAAYESLADAFDGHEDVVGMMFEAVAKLAKEHGDPADVQASLLGAIPMGNALRNARTQIGVPRAAMAGLCHAWGGAGMPAEGVQRLLDQLLATSDAAPLDAAVARSLSGLASGFSQVVCRASSAQVGKKHRRLIEAWLAQMALTLSPTRFASLSHGLASGMPSAAARAFTLAVVPKLAMAPKTGQLAVTHLQRLALTTAALTQDAIRRRDAKSAVHSHFDLLANVGSAWKPDARCAAAIGIAAVVPGSKAVAEWREQAILEASRPIHEDRASRLERLDEAYARLDTGQNLVRGRVDPRDAELGGFVTLAEGAVTFVQCFAEPPPDRAVADGKK